MSDHLLPNDVVDRLRGFEGSDALGEGDFSICAEAADEIEQLREALDHTAGFAMSLCLAEGREAAAEIERLRRATHDPGPVVFQSTARGCICPPGANKDCESPTCPRKPTQPTGLEYRGG